MTSNGQNLLTDRDLESYGFFCTTIQLKLYQK
jgi:hypothetical protein